MYIEPRKRSAINNQLCALTGKTLTGLYYGQPYTGLAISNRMITTRPYDIELTVRIDSPLTVYSHTREAGENILITAADIISAHNGQVSPTTINGITL